MSVVFTVEQPWHTVHLESPEDANACLRSFASPMIWAMITKRESGTVSLGRRRGLRGSGMECRGMQWRRRTGS